jgi:pyruvate/2-oxoglutarate/acetoin dehydrogenase E1 component
LSVSFPFINVTFSQNLFTALNSAMRVALETDPKVVLFGEDVAFGGVFRFRVNAFRFKPFLS